MSPLKPHPFYSTEPVRSWVPNHENNKSSTASENLDHGPSPFIRLRNSSETDIPVSNLNVMIFYSGIAGTIGPM